MREVDIVVDTVETRVTSDSGLGLSQILGRRWIRRRVKFNLFLLPLYDPTYSNATSQVEFVTN